MQLSPGADDCAFEDPSGLGRGLEHRLARAQTLRILPCGYGIG
jgi:hypothetical protein